MTTTSQRSAETDVVSLDIATTLEPVSSSAPVLISEQEVVFTTAAAVFTTAAAALVPPATTHRHFPGTRLFAAIRHIHIALPEPRPIYPRLEASYFESPRMSRLMDHL
jgi:hypothetical protein